jgi:hypothetical protein
MGACEMPSCLLFVVLENRLQRLLMTFGDWLVMVTNDREHVAVVTVIVGDVIRRGDTDVSVMIVPLLVAHQSGEICTCIPHSVQWRAALLQ